MISEKAKKVIKRLIDSGYTAYAVGGCVRDSIMGASPSDYDITTSAKPKEIEEAFAEYRIIETGIKHGTVTVIYENEPFEVTTYRTDGEYEDHRHPKSVSFTDRIEDDLARRDFTMNSIAMSYNESYVDPFGGFEDIKNRIIRATGEPEVRFEEDALRILRGLRFSSVLGFEIEEKTSQAIHKTAELLKSVSVERIYTELVKILCGKNVFRVLTEYRDVLGIIIPEIVPAFDFDHMSKYHQYDVYTHILKTVENVQNDPILRLTMLFHDIGKPYSYQHESDSIRHFRGHSKISAEIAEKVLKRLHVDNHTIDETVLLVSGHDRELNSSYKYVRRLFLTYTYEQIVELCLVKIADAEAHAEGFRERSLVAKEVLEIAKGIKESQMAMCLKDLDINGNDIMALGASGREIGQVLNKLLEDVIDEKLENEKSALIDAAKEYIEAIKSNGTY